MARDPKNLDVKELVRNTLETQNLGVLATLDRTNPYENLVAFVSSKDLKSIVFSTAVYTRKYTNLSTHPQVSFLVDTRSNSEKDFHECVAVTALGKAVEVQKEQRSILLRQHLKKHPYLEDFVKSPSCRLFRIQVRKYIVVSEFQKVVEFTV
ncbi:MAG: pyridoxamine 5'-phosphate oxidase family protein [Candidatus Aminicenantes bacterium]|jgi:nitroimidazol reductase NimA-like FMN-containing flavoprotein (pyridoxamine 5'-phosphate oxidase superfamily)